MGPDIYDRMYEQLRTVGLEPLEAETWLELIFQISDIAKADPEDVKGPILTTIASGKMDYAALNSMQEKGVHLSSILSGLTGRGFPEVVTGGHVSSFLLKIALKQYVDNHKTREALRPAADPVNHPAHYTGFRNGAEDAPALPTLPIPEHKIEIYPNAVLIDGKRVRVKKHGVHINNYANREELMTVTLELMPSQVNIHQNLYKESRNEKGD